MRLMTGDIESGIISLDMKPFMNHGELITRPAFVEGREQRCGFHLAVLMRNRFYVFRRVNSSTIAGRC
jgi:hypothetical protein